MSDDELLLIYSSMRKFTEGMNARELALDEKTVALDAAITQLQQLPLTLGKQTSQYIAMGVRQSIQDDFSRPIAEAVKGPIADLSRETYHAREVMSQVGRESRYQTLGWVTIMVLLGVAMGVTGTYYFFQRDVGRIDDRLNSLQQQIVPAAPAQDLHSSAHKGKAK